MNRDSAPAPELESIDRTYELIARVVAAYGGEDLWKNSPAVESVVSAWGPLPLWKFGHNVWRRRVIVSASHPFSRVYGIHPRRPDLVGVLEGLDVRVEDGSGKIVARRDKARDSFDGGLLARRTLRWDLLDRVYFTGYAAWNYLTLPALLLRADIQWKKIAPAVLEARFPEHLPTHSNPQRFHFDPDTFLLKQYDYTADVVGSWARAAHVVQSHENRGGVCWPYDRVVFLRGDDGQARRLPPVINLRFENCSFLSRLPAAD